MERDADFTKPSRRPSAPSPDKRLKVLLIDDDRDTLESLADAFAEYSCELRVADDGHSAIAQAEGFRPRLIVLDIGLPDMDGFEVARRMRARADLRAAWLVALTGFHDPRTRVLASEAGFDDYVVKPIDAMSIEAMIQDARRDRLKRARFRAIPGSAPT